jgi:hypothetical protein
VTFDLSQLQVKSRNARTLAVISSSSEVVTIQVAPVLRLTRRYQRSSQTFLKTSFLLHAVVLLVFTRAISKMKSRLE